MYKLTTPQGESYLTEGEAGEILGEKKPEV